MKKRYILLVIVASCISTIVFVIYRITKTPRDISELERVLGDRIAITREIPSTLSSGCVPTCVQRSIQRVTELEIRDCKLSKKQSQLVFGIQSTRSAIFSNVQFSASAEFNPEGLGSLYRLVLVNCNLTEKQWSIVLLKSVRILYLNKMSLPMHLFNGICSSMTNLEELELSDCATELSELSPICDLTSLIYFGLDGIRVKDFDLKKVAKLPKLRTLSLCNTNVKDTDIIAFCSQLPSCADLRLTGTAISDDSVEALMALPSLVFIDIRSTRITAHGIAKLESSGRIAVRHK